MTVTTYASHAPKVRDLAEVLTACLSRGAEARHLADPEDPLAPTFRRMVSVFMDHEGISASELQAATRDLLALS